MFGMGMSVQQFIMQSSTVPLVGACVVGLVRYRRLETTRRYLVWLSGLALLYLGRLLRPPLTLAPLEREPMFWVSAGAVLYFAGSSLIFLTSNLTLLHSRELSLNVWAVHALLYSFLNGFYIVALCVNPVSAAAGPHITQS